ncbi:hypothetical protein B9Z19DRAFT_1063474 [Tuber borchii]|uniref:Uncharacterized protein n=1 Tax=Tuber borchii TaxID=42251 RepID=A0A2T6ZY17_TUBBO|nr:hypothetical protein B9Z19DRAFT_1063474 [Tuber borchii]
MSYFNPPHTNYLHNTSPSFELICIEMAQGDDLGEQVANLLGGEGNLTAFAATEQGRERNRTQLEHRYTDRDGEGSVPLHTDKDHYTRHREEGEDKQGFEDGSPNSSGRHNPSIECAGLPITSTILPDIRENRQKRQAEAIPNLPRAPKRRVITDTGGHVTRGGTNSASDGGHSVASQYGDGFIIMCEVTNYRAIKEKALRGHGRKEQERKTVEHLFKFYTMPQTMARAIRLLGTICSTDPTTVPIGCLTVEQSDVGMAEPLPDSWTKAKAAGLWAHNMLQKVTKVHEEITLREVMAVITLHLIHRKVIEPAWKECSSKLRANIATETVWDFYYVSLTGKQASRTALRTFKDHIGYGEILFNFAQRLGAPALLMVAAARRGVSAAARELGKSSNVTRDLTAALCTSPLWWCFSHAIGNLTVARLFGCSWPKVTSDQLAYWIRSQPMPTSTLRKWETACHLESIKLESNLPPDHLRVVPRENYPKVTIHWLGHRLEISPIIQCVDIEQCNQVEELGAWLRGLVTTELEIGASQPLGLHVLHDLLPGRVITSGLTDFFCAFHNSRCVDGYIVLDSSQSQLLLKQLTPHTGLHKLQEAIGEPMWERNYREILVAISGEDGIVGCQISILDKCAFIYNWMEGAMGAKLEGECIEVGVGSLIAHCAELTILKAARRCLPAIGWTIERVPLDPSPGVSTKRDSVLCFLHLSRSLITGTKCPLYSPGFARPATVDEITHGLVVDGFALSLGNGWRVHPRYWFGLSDIKHV